MSIHREISKLLLSEGRGQDQDDEVGRPKAHLHHEHIKITITCRATLTENDLKISRMALLQPRLLGKNHMESGRREGEEI